MTTKFYALVECKFCNKSFPVNKFENTSAGGGPIIIKKRKKIKNSSAAHSFLLISGCTVLFQAYNL